MMKLIKYCNPSQSQAHCLVTQADTQPKPAKELAFQTHGLIEMNKARNANTVYTKWASL